MPSVKKTVTTIVQTCANCGSEFESAVPRAYCGYECEQEADFKAKEALRITREEEARERSEIEAYRKERDKAILEDAREIATLVRELTMRQGFSRPEAMQVVLGWMSCQSIKRMGIKN